MIQIPLTKGYIAIVDDEDADLRDVLWCVKADKVNPYAVRGISQHPQCKQMLMHRVILQRILKCELQEGAYVDHINGDTLDNRRSNLRLCTPQQNMWNRRVMHNTQTGFKGVARNKRSKLNPWKARIRVSGKLVHLGCFPTPEEAHEAYKQAAIKYFGEFARFE